MPRAINWTVVPPVQCRTAIFGNVTNFAAGDRPVSAATGDLNGDGRLDLVVANEGVGTVAVLLGTGTGSFGAPASYAVGGALVTGVAIWRSECRRQTGPGRFQQNREP